MKTYLRHIVALSVLVSFAIPMHAELNKEFRDTAYYPEIVARDRVVNNTHVIVDGGYNNRSDEFKDSVQQLITRFYLDQYRHFQDPRAPFFMLMSKDADLAMGIGGVIRMRGWYDWNGSIPTNGFIPYFINIPKDPTSKRRLGATPGGTAIYATIIGRRANVGNFMGYIEGGFNGYQDVGFKLKKAYVIFNDWTLGYATSTFVDAAAKPLTIDGAGPNGFTNKTNVLLRYFHTFKGKWSVAGGAEIPSSQPEVNDSCTKKCSDFFPDLVALGQYQWNDGMSHIRLSGLLRLLSYRDVGAGVNHTLCGWGAQLSAVVKGGRNLTLYGLASVGEGHGSYLSDLACGNFDLVADPDNPYRLYAPLSFGATLGATYYYTPSLYSCVTLGEMRYFSRGQIDGKTYKYGLYGAATLYWDIAPRIQVGAEYLIGKRMNFDGSHASANRIDALFMLSF